MMLREDQLIKKRVEKGEWVKVPLKSGTVEAAGVRDERGTWRR